MLVITVTASGVKVSLKYSEISGRILGCNYVLKVSIMLWFVRDVRSCCWALVYAILFHVKFFFRVFSANFYVGDDSSHGFQWILSSHPSVRGAVGLDRVGSSLRSRVPLTHRYTINCYDTV